MELYKSPELYDLFSTGVDGDTEYFANLAAKAKRALELGCGTGRISMAMAEAGAKVTALDNDVDMLAHFATKLEGEPKEVQQRIEVYSGDMRGFEFKRKHPLIVIPYRAFQHLHDVEDQLICLVACREQLTKTGRLVVNVFDPHMRWLAHDVTAGSNAAVRKIHEQALDDGRIDVHITRVLCPEEQRLEETWYFEKFDNEGDTEWRTSRKIGLRYFYRYEMEHLFRMAGLRIVSLEGGFKGQPYAHGGEQIWTVKRG